MKIEDAFLLYVNEWNKLDEEWQKRWRVPILGAFIVEPTVRKMSRLTKEYSDYLEELKAQDEITN